MNELAGPARKDVVPSVIEFLLASDITLLIWILIILNGVNDFNDTTEIDIVTLLI